jgi:hypothetical protein
LEPGSRKPGFGIGEEPDDDQDRATARRGAPDLPGIGAAIGATAVELTNANVLGAAPLERPMPYIASTPVTGIR